MNTTQKIWLILAGALLGLCVFGIAYSQNATVGLKWDAPTTHTDGTAISATLSYNVYSGAKGSTKTKVATIAAGATTATLANQAPNTCYDVTAVENGVGESAHSVEACIAAAPNKPTNTRFISVVVEVSP